MAELTTNEKRWAEEGLKDSPPRDLPILDEPPEEANYREATEGEGNCGSCAHMALGGECTLWLAYVDLEDVCDDYVNQEAPEVNSQLLDELAANDLEQYPDFAELALSEDLWTAYEKLDEERPLPDIALAARRWVPNKQPRWPKGAPNALGGQFMETADILARVDKEPVVDISPLAAGARNIGKVQLSQVSRTVRNRVDGASLKQTANPNVLLLSVRMKAGEAVANTAFYVSKKALGIQMIQNLLMRLNAGTQLKQLVTPNIRMLASKKFYNPYRVISRLIKGQASGAVGLSEEGGEAMELGQLFFSEGAVYEEGDLIWKETLPEGELKLTPGYGGKPLHKPLRVVGGHSDDPRYAIGLQDLVDAFDKGAIQHVTIPTSHADKPHENTGYIKAVRIKDKNGQKVLETGMKVIDKDIRERILDGRIANVSAGIAFDYYKKDTGDKFPVALGHVALTNKPWWPGMSAFGDGDLGLSEDNSEVVPLEMVNLGGTASWDQTRSVWQRRDFLTDELEALPGSEYELLDFDSNEALVRNNSANVVIVVPYTRRGDSTAFHWTRSRELPESEAGEYKLDPDVEARANAAREALEIHASEATNNGAKGGVQDMTDTQTLELSDEVKAQLVELEELRAQNAALHAKNAEAESKNRVAEVDKKISDLGLSERVSPGFARVVRELLLSDVVKETGVALSETHAATDTSVSTAVETLLTALPDGKLEVTLSEQQDDTGAERPPVDDPATNGNKTRAERTAASREFLYPTA